MSQPLPPAAPQQLYCVLIALRDDSLLLPNAVIAEVMAQDALLPARDASGWLAGSVNWNSRRLPVVNFEVLGGAPPPPMNRRARLVVLHPLEQTADSAPLAVVSQGYPHLITLNRAALQSLPLRPSDRAEFVLARVRLGNTEALIPDLDQLHQMLAEARAQQAG